MPEFHLSIMHKFYRKISAILAGLVFLTSGLSKLGNVFFFQQLIVDYGLNHLNILAPFIILFEIFIGALLIFRIHVRAVSFIATIVVIIFTCAYTYAWHWHGITDCGCFGNYMPIKSTPLTTYSRNITLTILLILAIIYDDHHKETEKWKVITLGTILLSATFLAGMTYKPLAFVNKSHPYENTAINNTPLNRYNTAQPYESELIMFFTYGCPHCINSMQNFMAWENDNAVDHTTAYVLTDSINMQTDSLKALFCERFPTIHVKEISTDSCNFINAFPTSFLIRHDTIKYIMVGELPSHYLFQ